MYWTLTKARQFAGNFYVYYFVYFLKTTFLIEVGYANCKCALDESSHGEHAHVTTTQIKKQSTN